MTSMTQVLSKAARRARDAVAALLAVALAVVLGAVVGAHAMDASPWTAVLLLPEHTGAGPLVPGGVTVDDGVVPAGGTGLDSGLPAVVDLDAALLTALRRAADAAADGAVDLGPASARSWLSEHGAAYGLCQTWRNGPWHYELRPGAVANGCPRHVRRRRARPPDAALSQNGCMTPRPASPRIPAPSDGPAGT